MKTRLLVLTIMTAVIAVIIGCNSLTPAQQQGVSDNLATANTAAIQAEAQIDAEIARQVASTQPTATQPAPTPEQLATEAKNAKALADVRAKVEQARQVGQAVAPIIVATASGQNPGPAIVAAAPLGGPYALWIALAGTVIGGAVSIWQKLGKDKATAAGATAVDGIQQAIANGQIVVTNAQAASATVDATANSHPTNDRLVDVIAAAPVTPVAPAKVG